MLPTQETLPVRTSTSTLENMKLVFLQLRPKQWSKNSLVFAALIFSIDKINLMNLQLTFSAFLLFCLVSGCVYILNDFMDREADRQHPEKRTRPMASGQLHPVVALTVGAILFLSSMIIAFRMQPLFMLLLLIYFGMNVAYSIRLKHIVILDLMILASGFVIRAICGGVVVGTKFTPWFLLCVFLLSLFLAIGKRRHELLLLQNNKGSHRKVLDSYSEPLLNQMSMIVTTMAIMCYSMFTFLSGHSIYLMWTIPLVIYGIFRYLYLIHVLGKGGKPDALIFEDKGILACVVLFGITVIVVLQMFG
ncbi:phosphoribose diphosphate--decaprenyl-phosphate phosphoribosyltransferase [Paenibacillus pectinilyticus]|uniref:Phosphoribose diphosphate--decaprenyl-phosphate phosphoribosyltransferase n=1 Tax=Paenibacillus pectinilyticus TaxID=512399 RepID=A0A1C0ZVB7_9BACL|nr:decaprenyl-phosphate phosphoribosyltransferase [Paenibacillus pectinilyticus]OCT12053.1 phosphoribose diphosphate--decaprenyl-phosphate phosphoribosyltransferase [Paenibacillus pectinilyticus]